MITGIMPPCYFLDTTQTGRQIPPMPPESSTLTVGNLPGILTAVDGTELSALAELMIQGRDIKLHTHFEPLNGVPVDIDLTAAKDSEIDNLFKRLLPGRIYVKDRGYACFGLFQKIVDIDSHFVCRTPGGVTTASMK